MGVPGKGRETVQEVERTDHQGRRGGLGPRHFLERWKPGAPARAHLLAAALLWTGVGVGLGVAGTLWCAAAGMPWAPVWVVTGAAAGLAKGRFALERTARSSAARIHRRGDGKCLGGFLSWKSWLFVLVMMGTGMTLRRTDLPRPALGVLYTAVGTALLWGSRIYWAEWRKAGGRRA